MASGLVLGLIPTPCHVLANPHTPSSHTVKGLKTFQPLKDPKGQMYLCSSLRRVAPTFECLLPGKAVHRASSIYLFIYISPLNL